MWQKDDREATETTERGKRQSHTKLLCAVEALSWWFVEAFVVAELCDTSKRNTKQRRIFLVLVPRENSS